MRIREPMLWTSRSPAISEVQFLAQNAWQDERLGGIGDLFHAEFDCCHARIANLFRNVGTCRRRSSDLIPAYGKLLALCLLPSDLMLPLWTTNAASQPIPNDWSEREFTLEPLRINRKRCVKCSRASRELESVFRRYSRPPARGTSALGPLDETDSLSHELW